MDNHHFLVNIAAAQERSSGGRGFEGFLGEARPCHGAQAGAQPGGPRGRFTRVVHPGGFLSGGTTSYPLVNVYITMENHHVSMGKSTINGHFQ